MDDSAEMLLGAFVEQAPDQTGFANHLALLQLCRQHGIKAT